MNKFFRFVCNPVNLKSFATEAKVPEGYVLKEFNKPCLNCGMQLFEFIPPTES